jgi:nucleotide-binding universal stress UspA family protein
MEHGFMKILAAIDDPQTSAAAIKRLIAQFKPDDVQVRIMHVVQPIAVSSPPQMSADFTPELESQVTAARTLVDSAAKTLSSAGFEVDTAVMKGDTRERIVDSATDWNADLVVVGAHNGRGIRRLLLGSVADYVTRHAPCSVELVRVPEEHAAKNIGGN